MHIERPTSIISPKVRRGESSISGSGIFASEPIARGEMVFVKAGHIVKTKQAEQIMETLGDFAMQISEEHFLVPLSEEDVPPGLVGFNHSCAPNAGPRGEVVFEALRDIAAGEEITTDYAMTVDTSTRMSQTFECKCGSELCRKMVTGIDWQLEELWDRYDYHFSSFIVSKIKRVERLLKVCRGEEVVPSSDSALPTLLITVPRDREHDLVFFDRKPRDEDIRVLQRYHFEAKSRIYDEFNRSQPHRVHCYETIHRLIETGLEADGPLSRVLAFGCGTAERESLLAKRLKGAPDLWGVDMSPQMCAIATDRCAKVVNAPLSYLIDQSGSFHAVFALEVMGALSCAEERKDVLTKVRRLLRPGSPVFFDAPNILDQYGWGNAVESAFAQHNLAEAGYLPGDFFFRKKGIPYPCFWHYFEEQELRTLLEESGFEIRSLQYVGYGGRSGEIVDKDSGIMFVEARAI